MSTDNKQKANEKDMKNTSQQDKTAVADPSSSSRCITCKGLGHTYWQCGNTCVFCQKRNHINRPCHLAPQEYPQVGRPSYAQEQGVRRTLQDRITREREILHSQETELSGLRLMKRLRQKPPPKDDSAMEIDENSNKPENTAAEKEIPPAVQLFPGKGTWREVFPDEWPQISASRSRKVALMYAMNQQAKGELAFGDQAANTPLRGALEAAGRWPPQGYNEGTDKIEKGLEGGDGDDGMEVS